MLLKKFTNVGRRLPGNAPPLRPGVGTYVLRESPGGRKTQWEQQRPVEQFSPQARGIRRVIKRLSPYFKMISSDPVDAVGCLGGRQRLVVDQVLTLVLREEAPDLRI